MSKTLRKIGSFVSRFLREETNLWLLVILAFVFILRLPSLVEPYWYGDEGIYLAVAQALRRGAVLYRDIWDNKTPLIYLIYAFRPTLPWAKFSATVCVLGTTFVSYLLAKLILTKTHGADTETRGFVISPLRNLHATFGKMSSETWSLLAAGLVGIFLSLPLLEGTIANAELYFTFPIALGAYLLYRFLNASPDSVGAKPARRGYPLSTPVAIGLLASCAFLLKVPAIFDFLGLFLAVLIIRISEEKNFRKAVSLLVPFFLTVFLAFIVPLLFFLFYFFFYGALPDFITAAFSQNASYVAVGSGDFSKLTNPLFLKALLLLFALLILLFLFLKRRITKGLLFLAFWFGFSLYGALLSNRAYMHYLLQVVPPAVFLLVYLLFTFRRHSPLLLAFILLLFAVGRMFSHAFALNTWDYYRNYLDYVGNHKTRTDYISFFDSRTPTSYRVANFLKLATKPTDKLFVWGDASFIYVLSDRAPAVKFIQAHHLSTVNRINYSLVISKLQETRPKYILVTEPVKFPFPELETLLAANYLHTGNIGNIDIYRAKTASIH